MADTRSSDKELCLDDEDKPIKQNNKRARGRSVSVGLGEEPTNTAILKAMSTFNKDILDTINGKNSEIMIAMDVMKNDIMERIIQVKSKLEEQVIVVKDEVMFEIHSNKQQTDVRLSVIDKLVQDTESRMDKLERQTLAKEVIIAGVPYEQSENVFHIVHRIGQAIGYETKDCLENVFRIPPKNNRSGANTPIIVKFWSMEMKHSFMSGYLKLKGLNLSHIGFHTAHRRIFINESLTKANREIMSVAQRMKKDKKIHQVRTKGGLVYVSVTERSSPVCIYNKNQLETLQSGTA